MHSLYKYYILYRALFYPTVVYSFYDPLLYLVWFYLSPNCPASRTWILAQFEWVASEKISTRKLHGTGTSTAVYCGENTNLEEMTRTKGKASQDDQLKHGFRIYVKNCASSMKLVTIYFYPSCK